LKKYVEGYSVEGIKGGAKRTSKFINISYIEKNIESINKYKLFFSKAYMTTSTVPPEIIKGYPNSVSTETFLKIGDFDTEEEMIKDRKSTRLNSSHVSISYDVFCLKKKI